MKKILLFSIVALIVGAGAMYIVLEKPFQSSSAFGACSDSCDSALDSCLAGALGVEKDHCWDDYRSCIKSCAKPESEAFEVESGTAN